MGAQFKKQFNITTPVKLFFVNIDSGGNSVYRFAWSRVTSPNSGHPGRIQMSKTFAVSKSGSIWSFSAPNYNVEGSNPIPDPNNVFFQPSEQTFTREREGGDVRAAFTSPLRDAKERARGIIQRWIDEESIDFEVGLALLNRVAAMSDLRDVENAVANIPGQGPLDDLFTPFPVDDGGGGFSGGGGGGFAGPVYRAPDRRNTQDLVKGMLVSLIGSGFTIYEEEFTDLYMKEDRRNFDSATAAIDPATSVLEAIRNTEEYKTIHKLRPESTDERTWISDRIRAAEFGGLTESLQEEFAITQATVGGDIEDVQRAASVAQFQSSGQAEGGLERKLRSVAEGLFSQVRV